MYDKAKELRQKEKQVILKRIDVSVNLNTLLQQIRERGIVVVYRCPNCGGTLKIKNDASVESIKVCDHCDSTIETMDLTDFLKTSLS